MTTREEAETGSLKPRRAGTRVSSDEGARCVVTLLREFAGRVTDATKAEPAIRPPEDGMVRLGSRERASYVWFLPCAETARTPDGSRPQACNHGIGIDRIYGAYEVRAWAHGAPGVHDLSLHTNVVTIEILETAARLIGLPFSPPHPQEISFSDPEGERPTKECRA